MAIVWAILLVLVLLVFLGVTLLGVPGNWLMTLATSVYAALATHEGPLAIGWAVVLVLVILALVAELIEFFAGALGTAKVGGSRRGVALSIVGSIVGGFVGIYVGLPIPIIGSVIAALLFSALGALAGAFLGELWKGRNLGSSTLVGLAAFVGRILGTMVKVAICFVMLAVVVGALIV